MKKFLLILPIALLVAGCPKGQPFGPIANPIQSTQLYQAELVFDGSVKTFNELKDLCVQRVLKPSCRTYVLKGQVIIAKGYSADKAARNFVAQNPTLDPINAVIAFQNVITDFKNTISSLSATK